MQAMENVAVIGACGKMGRGIALLLLQEIALTRPPEKFHLALIDTQESKYYELKGYLREQMRKFAEKNINRLRDQAKGNERLISNQEIIEAFLEKTLRVIDCSPSLEAAKGAQMVFEAVFEDSALKGKVLKEIHQIAPEAWVFTNTSSLPIGQLAAASGLEKQLIGFHFYNPPAVQKLLEIIPAKTTSQELLQISMELGKRLGKVIVISADVPGFIGNGHFAQEVVYACALAEKYGVEKINRITQDYLLRPMGIFQLLDYVGLPVIQQVLLVMNLKAPLVEKWIQEGIVGGKAGIFNYLNGAIEGVFSLEEHGYVPLQEKIEAPPLGLSWKKIREDPALLNKLPSYFEALRALPSEEGKIALEYLKKSKEIAEDLVRRGVAKSPEDVSTVLKNGFYHLYGI